MTKGNWFIEFIVKILTSLLFSSKKKPTLQIPPIPPLPKIEPIKKPDIIHMTELLSNNSLDDQTEETKNNLEILLTKINLIRHEYGHPMIVTSGLRNMVHHLEIYAAKGITDRSKIPMGSQHLKGGAADIYDKDGKFYLWCKENEKFLEEVGVWLETRQGNWQHLQIAPFKSYVKGGTIWFNPWKFLQVNNY